MQSHKILKKYSFKENALIIALFTGLLNCSFADDSSSAVLVKRPGAFQLASDSQQLVNFDKLIADCFLHSSKIKTDYIDSALVLKIINHRINSSNTPPVIHCKDMISAYVDMQAVED
jgi:hypothetical protein